MIRMIVKELGKLMKVKYIPEVAVDNVINKSANTIYDTITKCFQFLYLPLYHESTLIIIINDKCHGIPHLFLLPIYC